MLIIKAQNGEPPRWLILYTAEKIAKWWRQWRAMLRLEDMIENALNRALWPKYSSPCDKMPSQRARFKAFFMMQFQGLQE